MNYEDDHSYITRIVNLNEGFALVERDMILYKSIPIRKDNLVIDGNGFTIDANGKTRIFDVYGKNIVLKNFIFKNGNATMNLQDDGGYGGVIRNEGHLILENCLFVNNEAEKDGNDILNHGVLEIKKCVFSQNNSNYSIFNLGSIKIPENQIESLKNLINGGEIECLFEPESDGFRAHRRRTEYNFKYLDDLIHSGEKTIYLESDIVLGFDESFNYVHGIKIDVDDIVIEGNGHSIDAKSLTRIFSIFGRNIIIKDLIFQNGYSSTRSKEEMEDDGYPRGYREPSPYYGYGGAINNQGELELINCLFFKNNSMSFGGAIVNMSGHSLKIKDCTFMYNSAYNGGAIFNKSQLEIEDTSFYYNGGPLYTRDNFQKPKMSFAKYTKFGGAILNEKNLKLDNCYFKYNYARRGGAINDYYSDDLRISGCTFSTNSSKFVGAINNYGGKIEINDSVFLNNIPNKVWGMDDIIFAEFDKYSYTGHKPQISCGAIRSTSVVNINRCKFISNHGFPKSIENRKKGFLTVNESYFSNSYREEIRNKGKYREEGCEFNFSDDEITKIDEDIEQEIGTILSFFGR